MFIVKILFMEILSFLWGYFFQLNIGNVVPSPIEENINEINFIIHTIFM